MECSKCHKNKPQKAFATYKTRKGETRRRGVCRKCRGDYATENFERLQAWRREYNKKNREKKKARDQAFRVEARAYVEKCKARPCKDCKGRFPPVAMDFDHVRGAKVRNIARLLGSGYKLDLIKEEIKKCDVVCANCHRVRTAKRKQNLAPHRTIRTSR